MKQKCLHNHSLQEGVFFLLMGGALLRYGLDSHSKSFNKDWTQSAYLFPVIVALLLCALAVMLLCQGVRETNAQRRASGGEGRRVLIVLAMTLAYYLALAVVKLPYIATTVLSLTLTLSTFEVATFVFLLVMMLYLGVRNRKVLAIAPLATTVFLSVMFRTLLRVLLP